MSGAHLFGVALSALFIAGTAVYAYREGGIRRAAVTVGLLALLVVLALIFP